VDDDAVEGEGARESEDVGEGVGEGVGGMVQFFPSP